MRLLAKAMIEWYDKLNKRHDAKGLILWQN
jgi:hypothetical protein